jgi:hypothetical protein
VRVTASNIHRSSVYKSQLRRYSTRRTTIPASPVRHLQTMPETRASDGVHALPAARHSTKRVFHTIEPLKPGGRGSFHCPPTFPPSPENGGEKISNEDPIPRAGPPFPGWRTKSIRSISFRSESLNSLARIRERTRSRAEPSHEPTSVPLRVHPAHQRYPLKQSAERAHCSRN